MSALLNAPSHFELQRYPRSHDPSLRAWSAADEYLVQYISEMPQPYPPGKWLLVNDQFGALACCFESYAPDLLTDSYLSKTAIKANLQHNCGTHHRVNLLETSLNHAKQLAFAEASTAYDVVVMRIPKHLSLLEYQLQQLQRHLVPNATIIAGGMTKEIHHSTLQLFEQYLGPTKTSLAVKKARLVLSNYQVAPKMSPLVKTFCLTNPLQPQLTLSVSGLPGVFSREKLDIGTQVLLGHLPQPLAGERIIDLGCGTGVIGALLAQANPNCQVYLTDESALAIASTKMTFDQNQLSNAHFLQTDCLQGLPHRDFQKIFCNPPFHQQNVQTLSIATTMFQQAAQCLTTDGEFYVVANRHLNYAGILHRYFDQVRSISADPKFTVWLARLPK